MTEGRTERIERKYYIRFDRAVGLPYGSKLAFSPQQVRRIEVIRIQLVMDCSRLRNEKSVSGYEPDRMRLRHAIAKPSEHDRRRFKACFCERGFQCGSVFCVRSRRNAYRVRMSERSCFSAMRQTASSSARRKSALVAQEPAASMSGRLCRGEAGNACLPTLRIQRFAEIALRRRARLISSAVLGAFTVPNRHSGRRPERRPFGRGLFPAR